MSLDLGFGGWFQVRLATDPDPCDETRGVSGYSWALPGEPDLDRIIRFQPQGAFVRAGCAPEVQPGVTVRRISVSGRDQGDHPLLGAIVDLADGPKFEGRNGIVAEDGLEPIVPVRILISNQLGKFGRAFADTYEFPFPELRAKGIDADEKARAAIAAATGVSDVLALWGPRRDRLEEALRTTADPALREACRFRIAFMDAQTAAGFFGVRMHYAMKLAGPIEGRDPLPKVPPLALEDPWRLVFWMGGWDADAQCAFVEGTLSISETAGELEAVDIALDGGLSPGLGHSFRP